MQSLRRKVQHAEQRKEGWRQLAEPENAEAWLRRVQGYLRPELS